MLPILHIIFLHFDIRFLDYHGIRIIASICVFLHNRWYFTSKVRKTFQGIPSSHFQQLCLFINVQFSRVIDATAVNSWFFLLLVPITIDWGFFFYSFSYIFAGGEHTKKNSL